MTDIKRIGVFYSRGPHFVRVLGRIRGEYPDAEIDAYVPEGFPETPVLEQGARCVPCAGGNTPGVLPRLIRSFRAARYDLFVVMFDSPKLQLLAAASGARQRLCHTVDGRVIPVRLALTQMLGGGLWRRLCGVIAYARIWYTVRCKPVNKG